MWSDFRKKKPVIICGAHGGGTSFMTKLLRMRGFFAGADACDITERKTHESQAIKNMNCGIVHAMHISGKYQSGRTNAVVVEFDRFQKEGSFEIFEEEFLASFEENIWETYKGGEDLNRRVWGWKDPRNSLTLGMWHRLFPEARVMVIQKIPNPGKVSKSASGKWFDHEASPEALDLFMNPPALGLFNDVFVCRFSHILANWEVFNLLLDWAGLPVFPSASAFKEFKMLAQFEPEALVKLA